MIEPEIAREKYLRVTQILYPFSGLQSLNPDIVANAADRGTRVHKICESIASGLGEIGVDNETWGYVESFKKWWNTGHDVIEMERRYWDDQLRVTGQVDFIIKTQEGFAVVDLKTSSRPSKTWSIQGCAYAYLAKNAGLPIERILFIHLNKHGKEPKIHEYPVNVDAFLSVLKTYKHFYE